jgi:hypothetical protein
MPPLEEWLRETSHALLRSADIPTWLTTETSLAAKIFSTPSRREVRRFLRKSGCAVRTGGKHGEVWELPTGATFPLPTRDPVSLTVFQSLLHHFAMTKHEYLSIRQSL